MDRPSDANAGAGADAALTPDQRVWATTDAALWRKARTLAEANPEHDVTDLYHALRCLQLTPSERLRRGLSRGRLRAHAR